VLGLIERLDPERYQAIIVPEVADGRIAQIFAGIEQLADPGARGKLFVPGEAFGALKFGRTLGGVRPRMQFLKRERFDIVHINDGRSSANWALAARLAGVPVVWHHRGNPDALGLRLAAPLFASRVLTVSKFALPRPGIWSAAGKAEVVHSPFDTELVVDRLAARAALVAELDIAPESFVLGYFGAFVPRKRPLLFVDAIVKLRMAGLPVTGVMFGEARVPAMKAALDRHIDETDMTGIVRLMGYRTPGAWWIGACDQLVVPAVGEPFGRTLVEAMIVGTPVVAARSGGNIEALQGGIGVLVQPDDAAALAAGCTQLIGDASEAAAMAGRAGVNARHRFSQTRHCEQVAAAYARLAGGR
jgi:glycosyltransferase involved in cell wall biosynthesis